MKKVQILILAAGKGKRMNSDLPKALLPLNGKPMISYLLAAIEKSGVDSRPAIVVGNQADLVKKELGSTFTYIHQDVQHGTGHAVECAKETLQSKSEHVLVLYADQPLIQPQTIQKMVSEHEKNGAVMTMATVTVDDYNDWRQSLYQFGRVIRNGKGKVTEIVELKDCSEAQKNTKEVSPTYFCFRSDWLWDNIQKLENKNAQKEYYLTDLVSLALQQTGNIPTVSVDAKEALGANTEEQFKVLESMIYLVIPDSDPESQDPETSSG